MLLLYLLLDLGHNDLEFSKEKHEDLLIGSTMHHPHKGLIMRFEDLIFPIEIMTMDDEKSTLQETSLWKIKIFGKSSN